MTKYEIRKATEGYVHLREPILRVANQRGVASGKRRIAADGEVECEFIPIERGYYQGKVWLRRDQIE